MLLLKKLHVFVKSWKNASLVMLIHIFERRSFLYNSFLFGNAKKKIPKPHKKEETNKEKERRNVTAKEL